jgi:rubrerythrin
MHVEPEETKRHLDTALAYESVANRKYVYFAKLARELGDEEVARLFESIAQEETAHAFAQLTIMYPPGSQTVVGLLRMACDAEFNETEQRYPEYAATARSERGEATTEDAKDLLRKAERRLTALASKEVSHFERFEAMLKHRLAVERHPEAGTGQGMDKSGNRR